MEGTGYSSWRECAQRNLGNHRVMFTNCSTLRRLKNLAAGIINWINLRLFLSQLEELQTTIRAAGRRIAKAEEMARRKGRSVPPLMFLLVKKSTPCSVHYSTDAEAAELEVSSNGCVPLPQSSLCCLKFWLMTTQPTAAVALGMAN